MAAVPAPPPPPPPPPPLVQNENDFSHQPIPKVQSVATEPVQANTPEARPGESALHPNQLREYSKKWSLAGDSGLLLYLNDFSQRIISRTSEIDKLVESLGNSTKGSNAKVHNTFNDFLMLSSNQFIENRVYEDEITEEKTDKENTEKQEKTREQLESEILPRYTNAVHFGFNVLEDAFITVEIKPTVDDDSDDEEVGSISAAVADPIIEPKDVYSSRPLPYLIGTAEFIHDETIGLVEVQSEDEDENVKVENEESDEEEEEDDEEETSSSEDISEEESEDVRPQKKATKKSFTEESDDSENDLFGEPKSKKKHVESDESEDDDDEDDEDEEMESEEEEPKNNFQAELASKLGLSKPTVADNSDDNISNDVESIQEKKATRTKSKSKRGGSMSAETQSINSKKSHKEKQKRTKSIESRNSQKKSGSKVIQKPKTNQDDEDLFAPPQKDEFFDENNDNGPFAKKSGLFSGGGNSLFDEPEDDDGLFSDSTEKAKKKEEKQEKEDKEEEEEDKVSRTGSMQRTTSSGKRIPAGAVSIFGDASGGLFGSPEKLSRSSSKTSSVVAESPPKKPPPVVKGLFDEDDDEDMFNSVKNSNNLDVKPSSSPREKTLELEDEDDDLFGDKTSKVEPKKEEIKKKVPVGGVSMFGGMPPQLTKKGKSDVASISEKKGSGEKIFDGDNDEDNLFNKSEASKKSDANKSEAKKKEVKKTNVISLFDDDEDEDDNGDDIFSGLSKVKSESLPPTKDAKIPKSSSKPSSLFDEEDDDLFAVPTSKSDAPFAAPKEDKPAPAVDSASPVAPKKVATKKEPTPSSATTTKPASLFSGDGLFGEEDDLFVTKPVEKVKAHKKEEPIKKEEPTQSTKLAKAPLDPFGDDSDDDLFATSKPVASKQTAVKPSEKPPVKSSDGIFDDNQDDLFSSSKSSLKSEPKSADPAESSKPLTVEDEVDTKPKKPAGAVSLFGGIDPFAAKSNLKKTEKSHILASDDEDDDGGLFSAKKKPLPPSNVKPKPTPKSAEKIKVENDPLSVLSGSTKPVVTKPVNIPKKSDSPSLHADTSTKKNSTETSPKKASSNVGKLQASLNFNPSALLPGAAPPKKAEPITVASFDQPPDLKILENVSKTRARGQAKRRPPTRRARNVTDAKDEDTFSNSIDGNKEACVSKVTAAEVSTTLPDLSSHLPHKTLESKKIAVTDIFNDDEDDLFSTPTKPITVKTKQTKISDDDALSKKNPIPSSNEKNDNNSHAQSDLKDQINKKTDISDDLFGTPTEHNKTVTSTTKKSDSNTDSNDIFSTKVDKKKTEDNLFSAAINSSSLKSKETPPESHDDVFSTKVDKTETEDNLFPPKLQDNIFDNNDELFNVSNSKKQKSKEVVDDEDDLFATKPRKKEASKSKAKVVKKKTDDDLFGNSGSIFDDMPVASKDKKKKKKKSEVVDDIFSTTSSTDDIFASKKTKTKKKAEKSETKTKTSNVSDDKPNIFDDPLNALGGN